MKWRRAYAVACVGFCLASSGCASQQLGAGETTSSLGLGKAMNTLAVSFKPAGTRDQAWEDAVIAKAIAAHEMRHP